MKSIHKIVTATILACQIVSAAVGQLSVTDNFDKGLAPIEDTPITEWWKETWKSGWVYDHRQDFELSAKVKIKFDDEGRTDVRWWDAMAAKQIMGLAGEWNIYLNGQALAKSSVLENSQERLLLNRYYPVSNIDRSIFREPIGKPTIFDHLMDNAVVKTKRDAWIRAGVMAVVGILTQSPTFGASVSAVVGSTVTDATDSMIEYFGLRKLPDGGIEFGTRVLEKIPGIKNLDKLANYAIQLSEKFDKRWFLLDAERETGNVISVKQIYNANSIGIIQEFGKNRGDINWLRQQMPNLEVPASSVAGVLQRETMALSSKIFDSKERKPGDVWMVEGGFFSSFLHPDLIGRFSGNIVLRYKGDVDIPNPLTQEKMYVREIELLSKGIVNGLMKQSTLQYREPDFVTKLNEDTDAVMFVDVNEGYIRQANLSMRAETQDNMPDIKIIHGFTGVGDSTLTIKYVCNGTQEVK